MNRILFFVSVLVVLCADLSFADEKSSLNVSATVVAQQYCKGDDELFTVSLKVNLKVVNTSGVPVSMASNLVPWIAKIAVDKGSAEAGQYLYKITWSHYLPLNLKPKRLLHIKPGKSIMLHIGYDLTARYDPQFVYPKSVAAGRYAMVLVLKPETTSDEENRSSIKILNELTTEPFLFEVSQHPRVKECYVEPGTPR